MNKLFLAIAVSLSLVGCSDTKVDTSSLNTNVVVERDMKFGINLDQYPGYNYKGIEIAPEHEVLLQLESIHGTDLKKAYYLCSNKFEYMIDDLADTSTEEGSAAIKNYNDVIKLCVQESLNDFVVEFDTTEIHFGNKNNFVEAPEPPSEVETNYEDFDDFENPKPDVNDPRYAEVNAICTENNPGDQESIDLCTFKGL